jgi:hypothetical protein
MREQNESAKGVFNHLWDSSIWLLIFALSLTGCSTTHSSGKQLKNQFSSFQLTNGPSGPVTTSVLQQQVMRFADTYVATIGEACDEITLGTTNAVFRRMMVSWKLQQATAAYNDATGPNAPVNALDLLVLTTLARDVVQDYGVALYGDKIKPLLDAQTSMESDARSMIAGFLSPSQEMELNDLIHKWRMKYPHQVEIGPVRFQELAAALGEVPTEEKTGPESIFSLLYLNPLADLDPTTAAIVGIRDLGERTVYYSQRTPTLLNWQMQFLLFQLGEQPKSLQMAADFDRISLAAEDVGNTTKQLPQIIREARKEGIQQILDSLASQENKSAELLTNAHGTLDSAGEAATNIDSAIKSLTTFVLYVSPTNSGGSATSTNSHPFNVLDYGVAASQIGAAATNLQGLLLTANQSAQQLDRMSRQATVQVDQVTNHAFVLGVALIIIFVLLEGSLALGLIYLIFAKIRSSGGHKQLKAIP